eukprot:6592938-Lingulodinium_polyedra.AAC.1
MGKPPTRAVTSTTDRVGARGKVKPDARLEEREADRRHGLAPSNKRGSFGGVPMGASNGKSNRRSS